MTTTATSRMRIAALGLSTALSVGVLAPFIGTGSASAAVSCTTASANYSHATSKLAVDKAKLRKAKKKLRKAKHAHKPARVIKHDKKVVRKDKRHVAADKRTVAAAAAQRQGCTTGGTTTTPSGNSNPLSQLASLFSSGLSPQQLTDALNAIATQLKASGAPGADQLASAFTQLASAISSGASTLSPADFQKALQDAATALQNSAANPPTTAAGLVDAIVGPLAQGFGEFPQAQPLADALTTLQANLDSALGGLPGLGSILGGSGGLPIPGM